MVFVLQFPCSHSTRDIFRKVLHTWQGVPTDTHGYLPLDVFPLQLVSSVIIVASLEHHNYNACCTKCPQIIFYVKPLTFTGVLPSTPDLEPVTILLVKPTIIVYQLLSLRFKIIHKDKIDLTKCEGTVLSTSY